MGKPRILDLFCGAGGASMGYYRAGFEVVGVDIKPQPRYPFEFMQFDAIEFLKKWPSLVARYDAIHASPPCQAYTRARKLQGNIHPELLVPVRAELRKSGLPFVIENVPGAPLECPIELCGQMFGLGVERHRLFEVNFNIDFPPLHMHSKPVAKMGRPARDGEIIQVVGHFSGVPQARVAMGIDWMNRGELAQAIPPSYTEWIGRQLITSLTKESV
jgi:DNA (cytosine-5)-methyltransferase 1